MKQPISWHKDFLKNMTRYTELAEAKVQSDLLKAKAMRDRVNFLNSQITNAELAGKDGFDSEKYMVKRKVA